MGTEVRALSLPLLTITTASFKAAVKTTDCMSAAEQHNCKARQKEVLLHSTLRLLALIWLGYPPAMPCFLGTEEGDQSDLHGLMTLTVMSLDTHPAHCPGPPRRGPGMISSRRAAMRLSLTSLISQWTQFVYKWGMDGHVALNPGTALGIQSGGSSLGHWDF